MAYQPIVSWSGRSVYAYEALVRTDHPTLGRPDELFRAAEDLGRTLEVGRTIRASVAATLIESPEDVCVFVNLHPTDLNDDELFSPVAPLSGFAGRVVLEVSERASLERIPDIRGRVEALRRLGYRVALDDFGAGYAGLSTLRALQPEIVKLDMSLVRDIHLDGVKQTLVSSMVSLCRQLGMTVVAEGVENAAEREGLVEQGADIFQGFHFGRPGPAFPAASFVDRPRAQSQELRAVLGLSLPLPPVAVAVAPAPPAAAVVAPPPAPQVISATVPPVPPPHGLPAPTLRLAPALAAALPRGERGVLMRNLSHELRTPLNAIMGFAQLLYDGKCGPLSEEQRQHVADILAGGEALAQVADDIIVLGSQPESAVAAG
jgi:EAL domain-containing protein (putative c-di-GMP-specific phosphodiesterase class I)